MSKEFPQFSEEEPSQPKAAVKQKSPGSARGRKPVKEKPAKPGVPGANQPEVLKAPVAESKVAAAKPLAEAETKWEEVVPESVGGNAASAEGGAKRKRRRRKGKGGNPSPHMEGAESAVSATPALTPAPSPQPAKVRIDTETLAKAAWKIYLSEVSEEGVALVGDQDARDLARRCFRLAEIFLEERGRRMV